MQTDLAKKPGIEFPIFAFTHCRDVVVAVSKAGGFGVLGAVGFTKAPVFVDPAVAGRIWTRTTPTPDLSWNRRGWP